MLTLKSLGDNPIRLRLLVGDRRARSIPSAITTFVSTMHLQKELDDLLRYRNAYFLTLSATMGYVCFGWENGMIGGILALPSFQQYFGLDKESPAARAALSGNIVSVLQAGGFFGALISAWFANRYGRKPSMIGSAVVFLVGCTMQSIVGLGSSPVIGLKLLYAGRFFAGVGVGLTSAVSPTYVSECAPRTIRGRCAGTIDLAVGLGTMLSFWVNYGVSIQIPFGEIQWRLPIIVQMIPGVALFASMLFQPESPRWLVEKERYEDAAKSLAYIARTDPSSPAVQSTLSEIRVDFVGRRNLGLLTQFRKMGENRIIVLRCFIPSLLTFFQQWSGTNAITYYSPRVFASLGFSSATTTLLATGVYGVAKFVAICLGLAFVIEFWGRKRTLIYGGLVQAVAMFWIGAFTAVHPEPRVVPATYVSLVAVYLFGVAFSFGWGITTFVLVPEIAPSHLRPAVVALASGMMWVNIYAIAQVAPRMLVNITWGTYVFFGGMGVVMAVWAWAGVPETTGVPLEDVQWLFDPEGPMWVRCVQDAPGGRLVLRLLGRQQAASVAELKMRLGHGRGESTPDEKVLEERSDVGRVDDSLII